MALTFRQLHPHFVAEVGAVDLRQVHDRETLARSRGDGRVRVLVFRDQPFTDDEQLAFAQRFDGALHTKTGAARARTRTASATKRSPTSRTSTKTARC